MHHTNAFRCKELHKKKNTTELAVWTKFPLPSPKGKYKTQNVNSIRGTCYLMCPPEEIEMRVKEKLVHVLERVGSENKLVKCYSRSAADSNMAKPKLLRPFTVLKDTINYLLLELTKRTEVPESVLYDFIDDRLRAVRQDMTIQRLPPEECTILLEPMVRFYVYFGYKLCELPQSKFDQVLNKKYLLECMKWYLSCINQLDKSQVQIDVSNLTKDFAGWSLKSTRLTCDRILVESLYLLCNLDNVHPLLRYLSLSKDVKCHPTLKLAYRIAIENLRGNYIVVCRLMKNLCPLTFCATTLYLPVLQRRALLVMCSAYSSQRLEVLLEVVMQWLNYASEQRALAACLHYGLRAEGGALKFLRGDFKTDAPVLPPARAYDRSFSYEHIFTYSSTA